MPRGMISGINNSKSSKVLAQSWRRRLKNRIRIRNLTIRQTLSEFVGTFVLMCFIIGVSAQSTIGRNQFGGSAGNLIGSAGGVMMAIYISNLSGSHINPAITLMFITLNRTKWWKGPIFMLAQYIGAFLASACVYGVYLDALNDFDGGQRQIEGPNGTAGMFATYPKPYISVATAFFDQVFCTGMLACLVLAIIDRRNSMPEIGMIPLCIGSLIMTVSMSLGLNSGAAMNPARDLSPRIFTAIAGWGTGVFSYANYTWFWIPVVGSHVGAIVGALLYQICVGVHWPNEDRTINFLDVKT